MDKYAQLKRSHCDRQLHVYMHSFMHVDFETIPVEDNFPATKTLVKNCNKISTPVPVPKIDLDSVMYVQKITS